MDEIRFTPDEITALVKSGDLTEQDLYQMNQDDAKVALGQMIDAGKIESMGQPLAPKGIVQSLGKVLPAIGGAASSVDWKGLLRQGSELGGELAGAAVGSATGHPIIGMILGRQMGRGLGKVRMKQPTSPTSKPLGGPDTAGLKQQPNVSTTRNVDDVTEQVTGSSRRNYADPRGHDDLEYPPNAHEPVQRKIAADLDKPRKPVRRRSK